MVGARLVGVVLVGAGLVGVVLVGAGLVGVVLVGAGLVGVVFFDAGLVGALLVGALVVGANLAGDEADAGDRPSDPAGVRREAGEGAREEGCGRTALSALAEPLDLVGTFVAALAGDCPLWEEL